MSFLVLATKVVLKKCCKTTVVVDVWVWRLYVCVCAYIRPAVHLFGHAHEPSGVQMTEGVLFSNAAMTRNRLANVVDFYVSSDRQQRGNCTEPQYTNEHSSGCVVMWWLAVGCTYLVDYYNVDNVNVTMVHAAWWHWHCWSCVFYTWGMLFVLHH